MEDWAPYLEQLLGDDDESRRQALELLRLKASLSSPLLQPIQRARLLDEIAGIDTERQVFLLPWLLELLVDPSPAVRHRLLSLIADLMGGNLGRLLKNLRELVDQQVSVEQALRSVLERLADLLGSDPDFDLQTPFAALAFLRRPIFGLSALFGVTSWLTRRPNASQLMAQMREFLEHDERRGLRSRLNEFLHNGPIFLRYLLVRWLGLSGISLTPQKSAAQSLFDRYLSDGDPLVTSAAVDAYSRCVPPAEVDQAVERLGRELASFTSRRLQWHTSDSGEAVRTVSLGLLQAIGNLAELRFPAPAALKQLRLVLTTPPNTRLDLVNSRLSDTEKRQVFRAAMLVHRGGLLLRVDRTNENPHGSAFYAGFATRLHIEDPGGIAARSAGEKVFWASPIPDDGAYRDEPMRWSFQLQDKGSRRGATDLISVFSPSLRTLLNHDISNKARFRGELERQCDRNGWWMLVASNLVTRIIDRAFQAGESLSSDEVKPLFRFMADLAVAATLIYGGEPRYPLRGRLRRQVKSLMLNHFARSDVFDWLFPGGEVDDLEAQMLVELAISAMRSRPGDKSSRWIEGNLQLLRIIAQRSHGGTQVRSKAAMILRFFLPASMQADAWLDELSLSAKEVFSLYAPALALVSAKQLASLQREILPTGRLEIGVGEGPMEHLRKVQLCAEVLARVLEQGEANAELETDMASAVLGTDISDPGIWGMTRLRLLLALARCSRPVADNVRRLLAQLLRSSSSAELKVFLDTRRACGNAFDEKFLLKMIDMLHLNRFELGMSTTRELDLLGISDRLARRQLILRELVMESSAQGERFYRLYRQIREETSAPPETAWVVPAAGEVLRTSDSVGEPRRQGVLAVLRPAFRNGPPLAAVAGDITPSFVHFPVDGEPLRCLAALQGVPPGTLDLHSLRLDALAKKQLLLTRLAGEEPVLLLTRVVSGRQGGWVRLDMGADLNAGSQEALVAVHPAPRVDDACLVEIRRAQQEVPDEIELHLVQPQEGLEPAIFDLRSEASGLQRLHAVWLSRQSGSRPVLRASVKRCLPLAGGRTLCLLDAGFQWLRNERRELPSLIIAKGEPVPEEGSEVLVEVHHLHFRPLAGGAETMQITIMPRFQRSIPEGRLSEGTLRSERRRSGVRRWWGLVDGVEMPIDRDELTGDLRTLFALDRVQDGCRDLQRLASEPSLLLCFDQGRSFSVVAAPARWSAPDLMIGILTRQVDAVVFLRHDDNGLMIFEVCPSGVLDGVNRSLLPAVGTRVGLTEGELFDPAGVSVSPEALLPGLRLKLRVDHGRLDYEGKIVAKLADEEAEPFLRMTAAPSRENLEFHELLARDSSIRVRITRRDPLKLLLVEKVPEGFPTPDLRVEDGFEREFDRAIGTELEVVVQSDWRPERENNVVTVVARPEISLFLNNRRLAEDVLFLARLEKGSRLHRKRFITERDGRIACLARGLRLEVDSLLPYLLAEPLSAMALTDAPREPIRLTRVESRPRPLALTPTTIGISNLREDSALGLIVRMPRQRGGTSQVGVRWLHGDPDYESAEVEVDPEWSFDSQVRINNGDLIHAERRRGEIFLRLIRRTFTCTVLYQPLDLDEWAARTNSTPEEVLLARLLRYPEKPGESWLFSIAPTYLVEVPPEQLLFAERLEEALILDRVVCGLSESSNEGSTRTILAVHELQPGPLHVQLGQRFELRVHFFDHDTRLFACSLRGRGEVERYGALQLWLSNRQIPPGVQPSELARQLRGWNVEGIPLECSLASFSLEARTIVDPGEAVPCYEFELNPTLVSLDQGQLVANRKPDLEQELELKTRIETAGRVLAADGGLGVELVHYSHQRLLPLAVEEQTWLRHTGEIVGPGWEGKVVATRDREGRTFASLRRLRPRTLEKWLDDARLRWVPAVIDRRPLLFCGQLLPEELAECGLDDLADAASEPDGSGNGGFPILFEVAPGNTFTARLDQLKFLGQPFDPKTLQRGDRISRFKVLVPLDADGVPGIDLLQVTPDIANEIESFDRRRGIFFGRVTLAMGQSGPQLAELRGIGYKDQSAASRLGRWKLRLDESEAVLSASVRQEASKQFHYLKWTRTESNQGELVFRLAKPDEVFQEGNLVFVQALRVADFGSSAKLEVRPLGDDSNSGAFFIPDTQYSERRGRLERSARVQGGIFLARVFRREKRMGQLSVTLSLTRNPSRSFGLLMEAEKWQATIKRPESEHARASYELHLEVSEGVNVDLPLDRVDGLDDLAQDLHPGDVLFLQRQLAIFRVSLTAVVPGHLRYLDAADHPTLLTLLWGSPDFRQRKRQENAPLNCSLIGLSQLRGVCVVSEENLETDVPLPQVVVDATGSWVRLEEGVGTSSVVGKLVVRDDLRPELHSLTGEVHDLTWNRVTFREGDAASLAETLRGWTWRLRAPVRVREPLQTISTGEVIADLVGQRTVSLVSRWSRAFPVDYLIEQFLPPLDERRATAVLHTYAVAYATAEKLIAELAPGSYAELPASLLLPLHSGRLRLGLKLSCSGIAPSDLVTLEWSPQPVLGGEEFLSLFRLRRLVLGQSRHFDGPLMTTVQKDATGRWCIGTPEPPKRALPLPVASLDDYVVDLEQFPVGRRRYLRLRELFARYGPRLVLVGVVSSLKTVAQGYYRQYLRIGVTVPVPGREVGGDPMEVCKGEAPRSGGARRHIRVLDARFADDSSSLTVFRYKVEDPGAEVTYRVRGENGRCVRYFGEPQAGDSVLVYRPPGSGEDELRVLGYEEWAPLWQPDPRDPLQLHHTDQRRRLGRQIGSLQGKSLWATVEGIDGQSIVLSRRLQLDRVLPGPGEVVRCRLRACLSSKRILVDLLGTPHVLDVAEFIYGRCRIWDFAGDLTRPDEGLGLEVEVVLNPNGRLSALDVYELPQLGAEADATVELTAATGLIALVRGIRIFVPARELSWCNFNSEQLSRFFVAGSTLRVVFPRDPFKEPISHTRTQDVHTEIAGALRSREAIYVTTKSVDREEGRAIVRGRSGVLMELEFEAGSHLGDRLCAFVRQVDNINRRIVLTLEQVPQFKWDLPALGHERFGADRLTTEVLQSSIRSLRDAAARDAEALDLWASGQGSLEPRPSNLRLVLETLSDLGVDLASLQQITVGDHAANCPFHQTWREITKALSKGLNLVPPSTSAKFAIGYWLVIQGQPGDALAYLGEAAADGEMCSHFDIVMTYARALFENGQQREATKVMRELTSKLWASALTTLPLPLLLPESLWSFDQGVETWSSALGSGDLATLQRLIGEQEDKSPRSVASLSLRIWLAVARGEIHKGFDQIAESFFEALREEQRDGLMLDPRVFLVAAYLCFSRGQVDAGWRYLDLANSPSAPESQGTAAFWRSWLKHELPSHLEQGADPLLMALLPIARQSRWRAVCRAEDFTRLWEVFRKSQQRWYLHAPACRVLPEPPIDVEGLRRWALWHDAGSALPFVFDSRVTDDVEHETEEEL